MITNVDAAFYTLYNIDLAFDANAIYVPHSSTLVPLEFDPPLLPVIDPEFGTAAFSSDPPYLTVRGVYDILTWAPFGPEQRFKWEEANDFRFEPQYPWGVSANYRYEPEVPWVLGDALERLVRVPYEVNDHIWIHSVVPWLTGVHVEQKNGDHYVELVPAHVEGEIPWLEGEPVEYIALTRFQKGIRFDNRPTSIPWQASDIQVLCLVDSGYGKGADLKYGIGVPWEIGTQPRWTPSKPIFLPPPVGVRQQNTNLDFRPTLMDTNIRFGILPGGVIRPIEDARVHNVNNNATMRRVSDNVEIFLYQADMAIDRTTWAWSLTAQLSYTELAKVQPGTGNLVEVEVLVNGYAWRFLIESYDKGRQFGATTVTIRGRSVTAWLDDPFAPVRSEVFADATTARQIAEAEVTRPGLVTGFNLDWNIIEHDYVGWALPPHTWAFTDYTPIRVLKAIAESVGGYINSHPSQKLIYVNSGYPIAPWYWDSATPDITLSESVITNQTEKWFEKPMYNGVYVSGELTGVTAFVGIAGTAKDFQMPMYTNPLIGDVSSAREKGKELLSQGGKQARVEIETTLSVNTFLIMPGQLVHQTTENWKGLTRGVTVSVQWAESKTVTQKITLERHYYD